MKKFNLRVLVVLIGLGGFFAVPAQAGVYLYAGITDIYFGGDETHVPPTLMGLGFSFGGDMMSLDASYGFTISDGEFSGTTVPFQLNQSKVMLTFHTAANDGDLYLGFKGGMVMTDVLNEDGDSLADDSKPAYGFVIGSKNEFDIEFLMSTWNPDDAMPEDDDMIMMNFNLHF